MEVCATVVQAQNLPGGFAGRGIHEGDAHHVGRTGGSERHTGDDDDALADVGEPVAERNRAGPVHHVILVARIGGDHAVHPPDDRQLAAGQGFGEIDTIGGCGRSRATRKAVAPDDVQHTTALRSSVSAI